MSVRFLATPLQAPLIRPEPRQGGWNAALTEALIPSAATAAVADRLARPGLLVVTTGQQPGLFGGPLYTTYKALSAAALARTLERLWQRPVVPVFWSAGDDHDFAEASVASWLTADGGVVSARLPERSPDAPLTPLCREPVGDRVAPLLAQLETSLPPGEAGAWLQELLRRHYRPEATLAAASAGLLAELLAPMGVVVLDPTHPVFKRAQVPVLLKALGGAQELDRRLADRLEGLRAKGEAPDMQAGDGATLVMLEGARGRDRLISRQPGFVTRRGGEALSFADLERIGRDAPERLSGNVLLRPVIESALLPTVAYVGGPGELRYLGLAETVYSALQIPRQPPVPRWSGLAIESRVDRVLDKFQATMEELLAPGEQLEARVVRSALPANAAEALSALRTSISGGYEPVLQAAVAIDPTIERTIQNLRNQALGGVDDAEKRLVSHLKKRQSTETVQIRRARDTLLPLGQPQERVLSLAPWLGRHGTGVLSELLAVMEGWYTAGLEALPGTR
jgi:bacillithiol biosynthesis cysteine-adding enzyme BshC